MIIIITTSYLVIGNISQNKGIHGFHFIFMLNCDRYCDGNIKKRKTRKGRESEDDRRTTIRGDVAVYDSSSNPKF